MTNPRRVPKGYELRRIGPLDVGIRVFENAHAWSIHTIERETGLFSDEMCYSRPEALERFDSVCDTLNLHYVPSEIQ